jgi:hypothetical protein
VNPSEKREKRENRIVGRGVGVMLALCALAALLLALLTGGCAPVDRPRPAPPDQDRAQAPVALDALRRMSLQEWLGLDERRRQAVLELLLPKTSLAAPAKPTGSVPALPAPVVVPRPIASQRPPLAPQPAPALPGRLLDGGEDIPPVVLPPRRSG